MPWCRRIVLVLALAGLVGCDVAETDTAATAPVPAREPPRLILQITVDQLRGDLPLRYEAQFGEGGFRYLLEQGIYFDNAHHAHANTETVVGHTTLATGAHPAAHGMVGNLWFDRKAGRTDSRKVWAER